MDRYLMVALGGGVGACFRYMLGSGITQRFGGRFPWATFTVNITGSFLIGVFVTLLTERYQTNAHWRLLLITGVLGGYTTFSTFEYETYQSMRQGDHVTALVNMFGSVVIGYLAVICGVLAAGKR